MKHNVAVEFQNVSFSYNGTEVLKNVSFHIHKGEFVTIIGSNGTGKTTLLKLLLGLLQANTGKIEIFGKKVLDPSLNVGYVPQMIDVDSKFPITVESIVKMGLLGSKEKSKNDLQRALEILDLKDIRKKLYSELSGGQKRRALVARALISNPPLLLLDEPTANMDIESEKRLFSVLENLKGKTTIIIVTHETDFVTGLTDVILCLGKATNKNLTRHSFEQVEVSSELYPTKVVKVKHETDLPDNINCIK